MSESDDLSRALTVMLMSLKAGLEPIAGAVDGYRADCLRRGYSQGTAEAMAVVYHNGLMEWLFKSMQAGVR